MMTFIKVLWHPYKEVSIIIDFKCCNFQAQYIFIHDALEELITCGNTEISAVDLRIAMNRLKNNAPGTYITQFQQQFEVCIYLKHATVIAVIILYPSYNWSGAPMAF